MPVEEALTTVRSGSLTIPSRASAGPYLRIRTSFRQADGDWRRLLEWAPADFRAWRHQARAFAWLSSYGQRPRQTLITERDLVSDVAKRLAKAGILAAAPVPGDRS